MKNHLNAVARKPDDVRKVTVFCEDEIGRSFAKALLGTLTRHVVFDRKLGSISAEHYHVFVDAGISEFVNALIVLDGDKRPKSGRTPIKKNMVILPPNCQPMPTCPEKLFYQFLKQLPDTDVFWSTELDGHTKDTCFRDYESEPVNTDQYKAWFSSQKVYWGRSCSRLYRRWIRANPEEVLRFRQEFVEAHNLLAKSMEIPEIEIG